MATDLWMTLTTQISASGVTAALLYLDARMTLQANGASVLVANCLQACGKGRRDDLALMVQAGRVTAEVGIERLAERRAIPTESHRHTFPLAGRDGEKAGSSPAALTPRSQQLSDLVSRPGNRRRLFYRKA